MCAALFPLVASGAEVVLMSQFWEQFLNTDVRECSKVVTLIYGTPWNDPKFFTFFLVRCQEPQGIYPYGAACGKLQFVSQNPWYGLTIRALRYGCGAKWTKGTVWICWIRVKLWVFGTGYPNGCTEGQSGRVFFTNAEDWGPFFVPWVQLEGQQLWS